MKRKVHRHHPSKKVTDLGSWLAMVSDEILQRTSGLDTAVRDTIAEGLAHIVYAANDCAAQQMNSLTVDQWNSFISNATADWFRERGFAEWFCLAAANGFRASRPRNRVFTFESKSRRARK